MALVATSSKPGVITRTKSWTRSLFSKKASGTKAVSRKRSFFSSSKPAAGAEDARDPDYVEGYEIVLKRDKVDAKRFHVVVGPGQCSHGGDHTWEDGRCTRCGAIQHDWVADVCTKTGMTVDQASAAGAAVQAALRKGLTPEQAEYCGQCASVLFSYASDDGSQFFRCRPHH